MEIYTTFAPDPLWVLLGLGGIGSLIVGKWGSTMVGPRVSRWLIIAGVVILAGIVGYSLLVTWFAPIGPPK